MAQPILCTCGLPMFVIRGGFLACPGHCDGPECCRSNEAHCTKCAAYNAQRPTWAGQP